MALAYASQFLSRHYLDPNGSDSSQSSSQPIFFSFTSEGGSRHLHPSDQNELDDMDDPHLRHHDDDDPYLRLDDDGDDDDEEFPAGASRHSLRPSVLHSSRGSAGWLAHHDQLSQSAEPSEPDSDDASDSPPPDTRRAGAIRLPVSPPPRTYNHISLVESQHHPSPQPTSSFNLPDTRYPYRHGQSHRDSVWTSFWLAGLSICLFFCLVVLIFVSKPRTNNPLPYTTLLHTVPLLTILTILSALVAYAHLFVLRIFVKPVMIATSVFVPATLLICAIWAFIGSFMWEEGKEPSVGETTGLRLFSLIPLVLAIITFRRLLNQNLPHTIQSTSSLLKLTTDLLFISNPLLLALSPAILLSMLIISIPFVTLIFRLLLIGHFETVQGGVEWHVQAWADWAIVATVGVWLWTWGVARGVLRVTCAGVIGAWYFADTSIPSPLPLDTHIIHSSFHRSSHMSLGTSAVSALILTSLRLVAASCTLLRALPFYVPFHPVAWACSYLLVYLEAWVAGPGLGGGQGALVYAGLSGDGFWRSRGRISALSVAEFQARGTSQRFFRPQATSFTPIPLSMLTIFPLTLTFPAALLTYLFVAHTLSSPNEALGAAILAGGVTALVARFCEGVVSDAADTLWVCYLLDQEEGVKRRQEVFDIFNVNHGLRRPSTTTTMSQQPPPLRPQPPTSASHMRRQSFDTVRGTGPRAPLSLHTNEEHELLMSPPRSPPTLFSARSPSILPTHHLPLVEEIDVDPFEPTYLENEDKEEHQQQGSSYHSSHHSSLTMRRADDAISTDSENSGGEEDRMFPSGFLGSI
jgi:lipoprotein signal peptidase